MFYNLTSARGLKTSFVAKRYEWIAEWRWVIEEKKKGGFQTHGKAALYPEWQHPVNPNPFRLVSRVQLAKHW